MSRSRPRLATGPRQDLAGASPGPCRGLAAGRSTIHCGSMRQIQLLVKFKCKLVSVSWASRDRDRHRARAPTRARRALGLIPPPPPGWLAQISLHHINWRPSSGAIINSGPRYQSAGQAGACARPTTTGGARPASWRARSRGVSAAPVGWPARAPTGPPTGAT